VQDVPSFLRDGLIAKCSLATNAEANGNDMTARRDRIELLQGTLDLIALQALATMGPHHAYGLTARLEQVAEHPFSLNQGTLYPALVRLEQKGWIKGTWQKTEKGRHAKYYAITKAGIGALEKQANRWRRLAGLVDKLLLGES
jgi:PadR family transcriptional regulator, regulatory protein PadR